MLASISGCKGVIGFKAATLPRPAREEVRPARPDVGVSARRSARRTRNTQNRRFVARWVSFSRLPAPQPRIAGDAVPYMQEMVGVLHNMKPSGCVSPACRSLM